MFTINPKTLYNKLYNRIFKILDDKLESDSITKMILCNFVKLNIKDIIVNKPIKITKKKIKNIYDCAYRLSLNEPIQYILGKADFFSNKFIVNKHTLIPRNETEEIVNDIIKENSTSNLKVLDIGTGCGCIAISLALYLNHPKLYAFEVSNNTLSVAKKNAQLLNTNIQFFLNDILDSKVQIKNLDIIVSNPPYIRVSEAKLMKNNVLDYEPHIALFVNDDNPLIFYEKILKYSLTNLKKYGKIYLEINENLSEKLYDLLKNYNFTKISICKDLNNKDRWIKGIKNI